MFRFFNSLLIQRLLDYLTITTAQEATILLKRTKPRRRIGLQRGSLYDGTAKKPDFKRFSGTEKGHRNSIKITVALWRRVRDLNPGDIIHALRDFESFREFRKWTKTVEFHRK